MWREAQENQGELSATGGLPAEHHHVSDPNNNMERTCQTELGQPPEPREIINCYFKPLHSELLLGWAGSPNPLMGFFWE